MSEEKKVTTEKMLRDALATLRSEQLQDLLATLQSEKQERDEKKLRDES